MFPLSFKFKFCIASRISTVFGTLYKLEAEDGVFGLLDLDSGADVP